MSQAGDFRPATPYEIGLWPSMETLTSTPLPEGGVCGGTEKPLFHNQKMTGFIDFTADQNDDKLFTVAVSGSNFNRINWADFSKTLFGDSGAIDSIRFKDVDADGMVDIVAARASDGSLYTYVLDNDSEAVVLDVTRGAFYLAADPAAAECQED